MSEDVEITVRIRKTNLDALRITERADAKGPPGVAKLLARDDGTYRLLLDPLCVPRPERVTWEDIGAA